MNININMDMSINILQLIDDLIMLGWFNIADNHWWAIIRFVKLGLLTFLCMCWSRAGNTPQLHNLLNYSRTSFCSLLLKLFGTKRRWVCQLVSWTEIGRSVWPGHMPWQNLNRFASWRAAWGQPSDILLPFPA